MASLAENPIASLAFPETPTPKRSRAHPPHINANPPIHGTPCPVPVFYCLKFPEAEGVKFVARHSPVSELVKLLEVKSLAEAVGGQVKVSPAKSATSDTEIRIKSSFTQLLQRIKDDRKFEEQEERISRKLKEHEEQMSNIYLTQREAEYVIRVSKNASMRCIED
jgi:hypothetical protein